MIKKIFIVILWTFIILGVFCTYTNQSKAEQRKVILQWDDSVDVATIISYRIYYYRLAGMYDQLNTVDFATAYELNGVRVPISTSGPKPITIPKVNKTLILYFPDSTKQYYMSATAIAADGQESIHSNEVMLSPKNPVPKPIIQKPTWHR